MGYVSNLFKFKEIRKLKEGLAIGYYRKDDNKALLKDGKIIDPFIEGVSNNMIRRADGESISLFLVKHYTGVCDVYNRSGNRLIQNIREAAEAGLVKKELTKFNGKHDIEQYIVERDNGYALLIPQKDFVSDWYKSISELDNQGRRKVTETDLNSSSKELKKMGRFTGRNISYYIDMFGEKISPEFYGAIDAGEYKILWIEDSDGMMLDYIYDKDFVKLSYGYKVISYNKGKFIATDIGGLYFLIDEEGIRKSVDFSSYWVLNNGVVVGKNAGSASKATVYNTEYNVVCELDNPYVHEMAGIVTGVSQGEPVMFGYKSTYPVDEHAAELMVQILRGSVPPNHYTAELLKNISVEALEKTIAAYESIIQENLELEPENKTLQKLAKTAKVEFLRVLQESSIEGVRKVRKELKEVDKKRFQLLTDARTMKQKRDEVCEMLDEESEKETE